ncbi:putative membrane protein YphA (DoxX/SURF4 family) [Actinomadura luteofluorescens]|uniref:Putative membrane protein YphA (DoxX/SURF4 family) n=1 Tax=Actinomadura luteofluorescens TaxID=46163 RepID=A0A7Y9EI84_9ACTN|nr:MauE/DoxX family redox-associated membrane protein [Actinomadura luteofluorescens]NYD48182.1 putative membrane protein YphA (DoxX/SURF4 family) [Actinomadura luteofluorescens]
MELVRIGCACLVGLVFAVSAVSKLRDFDGFARSVPALVPVPPGRARLLAIATTTLEALVPPLLVAPVTAPFGFGLAAVLLAAFTAAVATSVRRGRRTACRCFGPSSAPLGPRHLVRNGVLLACAVLGALAPGGLPPAGGIAVAAAAGLAGAVLIVSLDDIVELFARNP